MSEAYADTLVSHEWLAPHGGSENVFEQIAMALPGAAMQCLWNDAPHRFGDDVRETWLARTPLRRSKAAALPFLPTAWGTVDLESYDRVVASSHAFGHHLASRAALAGKRAFAYVHTPARYVWNPELDERGQGLARKIAGLPLKRLDRRATNRNVSYAANSQFVRDRIRAAWDMDATVIYPPVAVERIQSVADWSTEVTDAERRQLDALPTSFVLGASRLIEYKRLDLTMRAGEALDLPVVIAGAGPFEEDLRRFSGQISVPVHFVGRVSDELLYALYQRAELFVFMAVEDFGIMPVEAMAAGTPVLVNNTGGAAESVSFIGGGAATPDRSSPAEFALAAERALAVDGQHMTCSARLFGETPFRERIAEWVEGSGHTR
jgi:glycosyltransferase involved in cell wall biosynthesis